MKGVTRLTTLKRRWRLQADSELNQYHIRDHIDDFDKADDEAKFKNIIYRRCMGRARRVAMKMLRLNAMR